ncbi:hypothetical protein AB0E62_36670 [Streptomyces sp. NPDC038707]|uniref:hypothetical protein n=1 Tax=Streptomyces sp. NPDC038707 TaxID=3154329 RepID=UPI0033C3245D
MSDGSKLRLVSGAERDGQRLVVPACLPGQDGHLAGRFCEGEDVAGCFGELPGAVGGHPAELLFVHLDEHAGGQQERQECQVLMRSA